MFLASLIETGSLDCTVSSLNLLSPLSCTPPPPSLPVPKYFPLHFHTLFGNIQYMLRDFPWLHQRVLFYCVLLFFSTLAPFVFIPPVCERRFWKIKESNMKCIPFYFIKCWEVRKTKQPCRAPGRKAPCLADNKIDEWIFNHLFSGLTSLPVYFLVKAALCDVDSTEGFLSEDVIFFCGLLIRSCQKKSTSGNVTGFGCWDKSYKDNWVWLY